MSEQEGITVKKLENITDWYTQVVTKTKLADYAPIKGFMVIMPYGYGIWEQIMNQFDVVLKKRGVQNAYFPLLIPESMLKHEADHFEGFVPQVPWVTEAGRSGELDERYAIRPTSETIMYHHFSKWIRSYNDLPLRINQWCNIIRWEGSDTRPFLRTREFLWTEAHTVHTT